MLSITLYTLYFDAFYLSLHHLTSSIHKHVLYHQRPKYSQTCLKGSPKGSKKMAADSLIQVHFHCNLVNGTWKMWLLKDSDPLIQVTT